jgi:hypothetical protein
MVKLQIGKFYLPVFPRMSKQKGRTISARPRILEYCYYRSSR